MRLRLFALVAAIVCLAIVSVPVLGQQATSLMQTQWKTSVPFEFWIGDTLMPAGEYTILSDPTKNLVIFRNESTGHILLRYARNIDVEKPTAKTELKFGMTGERHVLHQLWMQGDMHGHDILHGYEVPELPPQ